MRFQRLLIHVIAGESGVMPDTERYNRGLSSQALKTGTAQDHAYQ
jgi:hypothetical protein